MKIEIVSEQLLRALGTGIALVRVEDRKLRFANPTFVEWFGEPAEDAALGDVFPGLDLAELDARLAAAGSHSCEIEVRRKRRTLVIAVSFRRASYEGSDILLAECQNVSRIREMESMIRSYSSMVERKARDLEREKKEVEKLLLNIMPRSVYEEYRTFGVVSPQLYEPVSVLMLDFVGFTDMAAAADPTVTVGELNDLFSAFDRIAERYGCERIKTLGDAYIAVAGLPHPNLDHARAVAQCAVRMVRYLKRRNETHPHRWRCRIGLASGTVVGSVVGVQKYVYDVFGPAVNLASRLQSISGPMEITVHGDMIRELADGFVLEPEREEEVRGFGSVTTARLVEEHGEDGAGLPALAAL